MSWSGESLVSFRNFLDVGVIEINIGEIRDLLAPNKFRFVGLMLCRDMPLCLPSIQTIVSLLVKLIESDAFKWFKTKSSVLRDVNGRGSQPFESQYISGDPVSSISGDLDSSKEWCCININYLLCDFVLTELFFFITVYGHMLVRYLMSWRHKRYQALFRIS